MKKKHSFLLLEVLIALSLIVICIFPTIRYPTALFRHQTDRLYQAECELIALDTFANIKYRLFENEISFDAIPIGESLAIQKDMDDITIITEHLPKKIVKRKYKIWFSKTEKESQKKTLSRIIKVDINLSYKNFSKNYRYNVFAKKKK